MNKKVNKIQGILEAEELDGWLLCGFKNQSTVLTDIFGITASTRKFFIFIEKSGKVTVIISSLETDVFNSLPFTKLAFSTREEMLNLLTKTLPQKGRVAIEISDRCNLPNISIIDYGTVQLIKTIAPKLILRTSANLVQALTSTWSKKGLADHLLAAKLINQIKDEAFDLIFTMVKQNKKITEQDVQSFIAKRFNHFSLITDHQPVVASSKNSSNPHFATENAPRNEIKKNELVLIDLWAKLDHPESVFADITWMGFTGNSIPWKITRAWNAVRLARDTAIEFVTQNWSKNKVIKGFEVDNICHQSLEQSGLGAFFIHRTGHSIDTELHGRGVNLDNFETHDDRQLIPDIGFSIEPGVYFQDFGVRSEINMFIDPCKGPTITTSIQKEVIPLCLQRRS